MASLGKVVITDKVGKTVYGSMTVVTKIEREEYTVTINAPVEFLANPTTVYPVTVDPTVTIDEYMDDYGNEVSIFEDVCLHTSSETPTYQNYAIAGNYSFDWSDETSVTSRMLYTISNEARGSLSSYLNTAAFWSASLKFTGKTLNTYVTVNAYPFVGNASGSSAVSQQVSTNVYNNIVSSYLSQTTLRSTTEALLTVNVTEALRYWIYESDDADIKFVLATSGEGDNDPDSYDRLYIKQSGGTTANVCLVIDYTNLTGLQYINASSTGKFLSYSSSSSNLRQTSYSPTSLPTVWNFTYMGANKYKIALATNPSMLLAMDDYDNVIVDHELDLDSEYHTWEISSTRSMRNLGTNTYLCADSSNTDLFYGSDAQTTWRFCNPNDYEPINSVSIADIYLSTNSTSTPEIVKGNNNATWSNRSDFTWSSSNTSVATVSASGIIMASSSASAKGYSKITVTHKPSGSSCTFAVTVGQIIENGKYYINNAGSGLNLNRSNIEIEEDDMLGFGVYAVNQANQNASVKQKWNVYYLGNGYYTLDIVVGHPVDYIYHRLSYITEETNSNAYISTQRIGDSFYIDEDEQNMWRILYTAHGNFKLVSATSESSKTSLKVNSSTSETTCIYSTYTNDNNLYDEWTFEIVTDAFLLGVRDYDGDAENYGEEIEDRHSLLWEDVKPKLESVNLDNLNVYNGNDFLSIEIDKHGNEVLEIPNNDSPIQPAKFCQKASEASIVVFYGHGYQTTINLGGGTSPNVSEFPNNYFAKTDIIVLMACNCGSGRTGDSTNFVNTLHSKGAESVIGFDEAITNTATDKWLPAFFEKLIIGESVEASCVYANTYMASLHNDNNITQGERDAYESIIDSYYIAGNKNNTMFD